MIRAVAIVVLVALNTIFWGIAVTFLGFVKVLGVEINPSAPATAAFLPIAIWIGWLGIELTKTRP